MPFQLPDMRSVPIAPAAPTPILNSYTSIPVGRPEFTPEQLRARQKLEESWHRPLTHVQRRFIGAFYANGFDPVAAAYEADPAITTEHEARKVSKKWLALAPVRAALDAVHAYYTESTKIRFDDIVAELKSIAFSDVSDFWDPDRECMNLPPAGDPRYKSIAELSVTPTRYGRAIRIKHHDKLSALEKLIKIHSPSASASPSNDGGVFVNVQTVNIMPVPQGMYLPAPPGEQVEPLIIDHSNAALTQARPLPGTEASALATE